MEKENPDRTSSKGRVQSSKDLVMAQVPIKNASWSAEKENELYSLKEDIKSIEVTLKRTMEAKHKTESENSALQARNTQLQRDFEEMANKADKILDEKESIQKKLEKTSRELVEIGRSALKKRNEQLQRDFEEMTNKADKLIDEKKSIQEELNKTSLQLEELKKKTKTINSSQTYPGQQQYQANQSKQFSQTINISKSHQQPTSSGHIAFGADQTLAYGGQKYYPETMYIQLQQHAAIQQNDIADLQSELKDKNKESLRSRLSSFASKQLTEGNPDFTDLSDKNRPTIIADKFHSMYDDEWTSALEALTHTQKGQLCLSEEEAINLLMDIIKTIFAFCTDYSRKQKQMIVYFWNQSLVNPFATAYSVATPESATPAVSSTISEAVVKEFQERRKIVHTESTKNAIKIFKEEVMLKQPKFKGKVIPPVEKYVEKSVELLWLMSVQDPPMVIKWPEPNSKFDTDNYKEYLRKGKAVKMAVWPAVFLHEKGALMSKGFAMPI